LFQLNIRLPADLEAGDVPVVIRIGNTASASNAYISVSP
jgi:uncharacterized protein (TIGR03437 family)